MGQAYPDRRVGLLVPSSNTVMEPDFATGLGPDVTLHTARMYLADTTAAGEWRMLEEFALPAARDLASAHPDVVVYGCTSAGALRGNAYDAELCTRISEVTGVRTISTIGAVRAAIRTSGARRVGVITPYVAELNAPVKQSVEADGPAVVKIAGLGITDNFAISRVPPGDIEEFAARELSGLGIDLALASCTNFAALAAVDGIHARLGVPVVTSNQAALAATRDAIAAGARTRIPRRE